MIYAIKEINNRFIKGPIMKYLFTAKVYCNEEKIAYQSGDDIELLHAWMLGQVKDNFGDVHGKIIDNKTKKIVRTFRKSDVE